MPMQSEAENWLRFAEDDLKMAALALREEIYTQTCFHAQQAAEKALKGLLVYQRRVPPKTHRLLYLWEQLSPNPLAAFKEEISLLNLFYAPTRYPDALPGSLPEGSPSRDLAEKALSWSQTIFQEVKRQTERGGQP